MRNKTKGFLRRLWGRQPRRAGVRPAKYVPSFDCLEDRTLLSGTGFLQGTAFIDGNNNNLLDPSDARLAGATITLYKETTPGSGTFSQLGSPFITGSDGNYLFTGLEAAKYRVVETAAAGYLNTGTQVLSQIYSAAAVNSQTIEVTVLDPDTLSVLYNNPGPLNEIITVFLQGYGDVPTTAGNMDLIVKQNGVEFTNYLSYCVDLYHTVYPGNTFPVTPLAANDDPFGLLHAGEVAFLYNHYGTDAYGTGIMEEAVVDEVLATDKAIGLQLAMWELLGDATPDLSAGTFRYLFADARAQWANFYLADSAGKSETAMYLDATKQGTISGDERQGMIATGSLNFANASMPSVSGFVYVDYSSGGTNNGVKNIGEAGIGGVTVNLTGTDDLGNSVNLTDVTDANGAYSFTNLRPGTYTITETTQPAGYFDGQDTIGTPGGTTGNDQFSNVVLTPGFHGVNNNFGELPPADPSGYVYHDADNDGIKDPGELGIGSATVHLTGTNDLGESVSVTMTTDSSGFYDFGLVRPGTYTITEEQPAEYLDGKDTIGDLGGTTGNDQFTNIVLTFGDVDPNNNFGELLPASLSGYIYVDSDNDGVKDIGEAGIPLATVTLTGTDDLGNAINVGTTTNAAGAYSFGNLRPGTYTIAEGQPGGYLDGKDTIGTPGGITGSDNFSSIVLASNISGIDNNFGELLPSSLAGYVYVDSDNDGIKDGGETGIVGVVVTLTGTDDLGNAVNTGTVTTAGGAYSFTGLRPGTYTVTETQPLAYGDGIDSIGTPGGTTANDSFSAIVLASNVNGANNNFGELLGSISGMVYFDANENGVFNGGDSVLSGVIVTLTGTNDLGNSVNLTDTTDSNGQFSFDNLRPGTYNLTETQPGGYLDGAENLGTAGGIASDNLFSAIGLDPGENGINYRFGEVVTLPPVPSSISGFVYFDADSDGFKDTGEAGLGGVTVLLTGTDIFGNSVSKTTTTAANGSYSFSGLRAGTYTVTEVHPAGYVDGLDSVGTIGGVLANDQVSAIGLGVGVAGAAYNFGEVGGSLSGFVYEDTNNDGDQDFSEGGIGGVTLTLTGTDVSGNAVSLTTTTNSAGFYIFSNLRAGTYRINETQPSGYNDGIDSVGSLGGTLSNDQLSNISLAAGANGQFYNFGEILGNAHGIGKGESATIGFWANTNGQALIKSFNGSATSTALGNWLASMFPNLYGASAGLNNLAGKTNAQIVDYYVYQLFRVDTTIKLEAQVFANALAIYATTSSLGGSAGTAFGFKVTSDGAGARTINVGSNGAAFGVANNTNLTILQVLQKINAQSVAGVLYANPFNPTVPYHTLRSMANEVCTAINEAGDRN